MAKKRNPELPTLERPCIPELDKAIADQVDAEAQVKEWKAKLAEFKDITDQKMIKLEKKLEKDGEGSTVYVYQDGQMRHTAVLPPEDPARHAKINSKRVPRSEDDE